MPRRRGSSGLRQGRRHPGQAGPSALYDRSGRSPCGGGEVEPWQTSPCNRGNRPGPGPPAGAGSDARAQPDAGCGSAWFPEATLGAAGRSGRRSSRVRRGRGGGNWISIEAELDLNVLPTQPARGKVRGSERRPTTRAGSVPRKPGDRFSGVVRIVQGEDQRRFRITCGRRNPGSCSGRGAGRRGKTATPPLVVRRIRSVAVDRWRPGQLGSARTWSCRGTGTSAAERIVSGVWAKLRWRWMLRLASVTESRPSRRSAAGTDRRLTKTSRSR